MSEPMYTSRSTVEVIRGTHRRVRLEAGGEFETGVHGPIKTHFRLDHEPDLPLPVDYVVGATGA
jgi:hypothetical protein